MSNFANDLKYGLRMLRKSPGFALIALLTLGLGIGATTSLFSVFHALVLNPFPYPQSDRIVYVWNRQGWPLSALDYLDIKEQMTSFVDMGVYTPERLNFSAETPESLNAVYCTSGVLRVLGMRPALGRLLDDLDDKPDAAPVAVISYNLWTRSFGADPDIVGQSMRLNGRETTIVGVMPADFEFSSPWYQGQEYELWTPFTFDIKRRGRGNHWLLGMARVKPEVTVDAADAEIKTIGAHLTKLYPNTNTGKTMLVVSLRDQMTDHTASRMKVLFSAVVLLLLVACANVASMLLARGAQRQDEFSVRLALGASRTKVARLLLAETLWLGLFGSVAGILFAVWGTAMLRNLIPARLFIEARRAAIHINGGVLVFSMGLAVLSALLAGLLPAFTAARTSIRETMDAGGRSQTGSRLRHRYLRQLMVAQIAVAVVLANAGVLLFASYLNVFKRNQCLDTDQVISAQLALEGHAYRSDESRIAFIDQLCEHIKALPGVQSVAVTSKMPLEGGNNADVLVDDEVYDPAVQRQLTERSFMSPDYFTAMGLPLLSGRAPGPSDVHGDSVGVVINRAMADHFWKDESALGKIIRPNDPEPSWHAEVIGVVENVRQWGSEHPALPEMYAPYAFRANSSIYLIIRTRGAAGPLIPTIRRAVSGLDADLPLATVRTMRDVLNASASERRLSTTLINVFMVSTLVLAIVGIYGTLSYNLLQRKRDIGVRIAFGARHPHILAFVFRQAGLWVGAGLVIGLIITGGVSFLLRSLVFDISPLSPVSLLVGLSTVAAAACLACLVPALRAAHTDPMKTLRYE